MYFFKKVTFCGKLVCFHLAVVVEHVAVLLAAGLHPGTENVLEAARRELVVEALALN